MTKSMMFVLAAAVASGCSGTAEPYAPDGQPSETHTVTVWVQDHPALRHNTAVLGCDIWYPEGIRCDITADEGSADVRVYAHDAPCAVRADGTFTLATAFGDRSIVFETSCFGRDADGGIDAHAYRTVMGHEIGHQFGIWSHVPRSCDEPHVTHPTGGPVCGQALMNPMYDANISFETAIDHLAFDMRDRDSSVLEDGRPGISGGDPLCVFTGSN
uniref:Uncharacterized protein n=1 Tax=uncultured bacterium pA1 TaxID=1776268 RepID=A0A0U3J8T7_9BACT|nr:hypothetical protein [uncultured bacterium pA1]